jgi:hypothetical protein
LLNYLSFHERLICSEELGNRHQTPTLIGCIFLTNPQNIQRCAFCFLLIFAAISEALYFDRFFEGLSTLRAFCWFDLPLLSLRRRFQRSLEFYTRI